MTSDSGSNTPLENVSEIVHETKDLLERLQIAVTHQSDLTKECTDSSIVELSEIVDSVKNTCTEQEKELEDLKKQIEAAESRLNSALEECKNVKGENVTLHEAEDAYIKQMESVEKHQAKITDLRNKLRALKWITGVRFSTLNGKSIVSGYLAISSTDPSNNSLTPFEIEKNSPKNKEVVWNAIREACYELEERYTS